MANRTVSVALKAEVQGYIGGMSTAAKFTKGLSDDLTRLGKDSPGKLNDVAMVAGGMGAALLGAAGAAVKMAMDFDKQMSSVSAATKASSADLGKLRQAALDAGAATVFSATDAAKAETELAKAGLKTSEILSGGLKGALDLAAAGQMDVAESAEISAAAMTQFGLKGADIPHVADLLAAAAGKAMGNVHDMGLALNQSGLVANQFGLSIEETTGTLAAFAKAGMLGSDAGTSLKTMLLRLANPSKEAASTMQMLGIHAYDVNGRFVGLKDLAGQLQTSMSGLSQAERDNALAMIFGADAIRAANVLYKQGSAGIEDWTKQVNEAGFASDQAGDMTDNLAGDLERLKGSLETLAIGAASGPSSGLRTLVQTLDQLVGQFSAMPQGVTQVATVLAGLGGASLLAVAGMLKVRQTVNDASEALSGMGPRGEKAAGALGTATKWGGRALGVFAALQVTGALLSTTLGDGAVNADKLAAGLQRVADSGQIGKFGGGKGQFADDVKFVNANGGLKGSQNASNIEGMFGFSGFSWSVTASMNRVKAIDAELAKLVQSGNADRAAKAYQVLAAEAEKSGVSHAQLAAIMPAYQGALQAATTSSTAAAAATAANAQQASLLTGTLTSAIDKLGGFKAAFDSLHASELAILDSQIAVEEAIDKLSETLGANAHTLDLNAEAGRNNMKAFEGVVLAARDAAEAKYAETGSVQMAAATYNGYIDRLRATLVQAGFTKAQVEQLIATYARMPPVVATQIQVAGIDAANEKITSVVQKLNALQNKVVTTYVVTNVQTNESRRLVHPGPGFNRWGGVYEPAATGLLREASLYSATSPGRYMIAEPETHGEAFVPKRGDYGRSMRILNHAAGWYGASVVPGGAGERPSVVINMHPPVGASTQEIAAEVRRELAWTGI